MGFLFGASVALADGVETVVTNSAEIGKAVTNSAGTGNVDVNIFGSIQNLLSDTGFAQLGSADGIKMLIMMAVGCLLVYLAIKKQYEPLLLLPIGFGMILVNLPGAGLMNPPANGQNGGLLWYLYQGVDKGIYPPLIFLGVGAMTDFAPLIANPKSLLLGAAAQLGIFIAFTLAKIFGQPDVLAASIGIIGGADGPTAIYVTSKLADTYLGPIAVAAYSYMALVPIIQPPIMKALTTKEERMVKMEQLRPVSKKETIIFPIMVTIVVSLMLPSAAPLVGMLMLGNLMRVSGVVDRISKTAQNELMNIVTIFLGICVGAKAKGDTFLSVQTLVIMLCGVFAFACGTAGGVLLGKLMYKVTGGKVNPLIGSAGVSAVPMAARVSQMVGQKENPSNFLLMHAMGPNVAGVIGSAVAAGVFLSMFAH